MVYLEADVRCCPHWTLPWANSITSSHPISLIRIIQDVS